MCLSIGVTGVIRFTGHMNNCVTRDMLLYILSEQLNEPDVTNWGTQCNRAVRHLYPQTYLKRKGKFKTYPSLMHELTSRGSLKSRTKQTTNVLYSWKALHEICCDTLDDRYMYIAKPNSAET